MEGCRGMNSKDLALCLLAVITGCLVGLLLKPLHQINVYPQNIDEARLKRMVEVAMLKGFASENFKNSIRQVFATPLQDADKTDGI
jgi:hypothetical protein